MMKRIIIGTTVVVGTPILLVVSGFFLLTALFGPRGPIGFDRSMDREYKGLELGTDLESVVERLGPPKSEGGDFLLPQRKGFEDAFARADESDAVAFYLWVNGMNWFYCLGFDDKGRLVVKEQGHS